MVTMTNQESNQVKSDHRVARTTPFSLLPNPIDTANSSEKNGREIREGRLIPPSLTQCKWPSCVPAYFFFFPNWEARPPIKPSAV